MGVVAKIFAHVTVANPPPLNPSATNRAFSVQYACGLPTAPTALHMPCADVTRLHMLDLDAGKGRQVMRCIQLQLCMSGVLQC